MWYKRINTGLEWSKIPHTRMGIGDSGVVGAKSCENISGNSVDGPGLVKVNPGAINCPLFVLYLSDV